MKHPRSAYGNVISRLLAGAAFYTGTASVFAHGGHGLDGTHWHATDVSGFVLVAVLAALAIFISRGK